MGILSALLDEASDNERFKKEMIVKIAEKNSHDAEALCREYGISETSTKTIVSLASMYGSMNSVAEKLAPICTSGRAKAMIFPARLPVRISISYCFPFIGYPSTKGRAHPVVFFILAQFLLPDQSFPYS
jgi:ATP phosphoribosyltransferase regulatory subunit HisZ